MLTAEEPKQADASDQAWGSISLEAESSEHDKQEGLRTESDCENFPFPVKGLKDEVHRKCKNTDFHKSRCLHDVAI